MASPRGRRKSMQRQGTVEYLYGPDEEGEYLKNPPHLRGLPDMSGLIHLEEPNVLDNLAERYADDKIYTSVSRILIAINPYKRLPLYGPEEVARYCGTSRHERSQLPPHVYSVSEGAYQALALTGQNQSLVVCGESGSGKTESAKKLMSFLSESTRKLGSGAPRAAGGAPIEEQVLEANPLLESFGNAKTTLNNNSSRFGKFTKLLFEQGDAAASDRPLHLCGSVIETYLLEKSRVIAQVPGERNYHVFYQLCSPAAAATRERLNLRLRRPEDTRYLNQGVTTVQGIDDEEDFRAVLRALDSLGFAPVERDEIFRTLAGILHLGDVEFAGKDESDPFSDAVIKQAAHESVRVASDLFGCDHGDLISRLTTRSITVAGNRLQKPLSAADARANRDAMAKGLYDGLFGCVVRRVNRELYQQTGANAHVDDLAWIGILDVFGFENFENNSFEQACINLCNERLQSYFNEHVIRSEQDEYQREAIFWTALQVPDNSETLKGLLGRHGVFQLLDSVCMMPKGTPEHLVQHIDQFLGGNSRVDVARTRRARGPGARRGSLSVFHGFSVRHYAGTVVYNAEAFLVKNADATHADTRELFGSSSLEVVREVFLVEAMQQAVDATTGGGGGGGDAGGRRGSMVRRRASMTNLNDLKGAAAGTAAGGGRASRASVTGGRFRSVGANFTGQLRELMDTLQTTDPFFVRCIKPNSTQDAANYQREYVRPQLRCGGIIEALRILKCGFPTRVAYDDVFERYGGILDPQPANLNRRDFCEAVLDAYDVTLGDYQTGLTKVFFRPGKQEALERILRSGAGDMPPALVARIRRFLVRKRVLRMRGAIRCYVRLQRTWRGNRALRRLQDVTAAAGIVCRTLLRRARQVRRGNAAAALQAAVAASYACRRRAMFHGAVLRVQRWARHALPKRRLGKELARRIKLKFDLLSEEEQQRAMQLSGIIGQLSRELKEWTTRRLEVPVEGEFFTALLDGRVLCRIATAADPSARVSCHRNAKPGTFFARDNIASFLRAAEGMGVRDVERFAVSDLTEFENLKAVVSCLLAVSRYAFRTHGVEPPPSVKYEMERGFNLAEVVERVEAEEHALKTGGGGGGGADAGGRGRSGSSSSGSSLPDFRPQVRLKRSYSQLNIGKTPDAPGSVLEAYMAPPAAAAAVSPSSSSATSGPFAGVDEEGDEAEDDEKDEGPPSYGGGDGAQAGDDGDDGDGGNYIVMSDPRFKVISEMLNVTPGGPAGSDEVSAIQRLMEDNARLRMESERNARAAEAERRRAEALSKQPKSIQAGDSTWRDANHMYFFITALACKLSAKKSPSRGVPTTTLYKRAMRLKVPFQFYKDFILQELAKPLDGKAAAAGAGAEAKTKKKKKSKKKKGADGAAADEKKKKKKKKKTAAAAAADGADKPKKRRAKKERPASGGSPALGGGAGADAAVEPGLALDDATIPEAALAADGKLAPPDLSGEPVAVEP